VALRSSDFGVRGEHLTSASTGTRPTCSSQQQRPTESSATAPFVTDPRMRMPAVVHVFSERDAKRRMRHLMSDREASPRSLSIAVHIRSCAVDPQDVDEAHADQRSVRKQLQATTNDSRPPPAHRSAVHRRRAALMHVAAPSSILFSSVRHDGHSALGSFRTDVLEAGACHGSRWLNWAVLVEAAIARSRLLEAVTLPSALRPRGRRRETSWSPRRRSWATTGSRSRGRWWCGCPVRKGLRVLWAGCRARLGARERRIGNRSGW